MEIYGLILQYLSSSTIGLLIFAQCVTVQTEHSPLKTDSVSTLKYSPAYSPGPDILNQINL